MVLSKLLEAYQKDRELDFRTFAEHIGCNHSTLWRFVRGHACDDDTLCKVLIWALGDEEEPKKELGSGR